MLLLEDIIVDARINFFSYVFVYICIYRFWTSPHTAIFVPFRYITRMQGYLLLMTCTYKFGVQRLMHAVVRNKISLAGSLANVGNVNGYKTFIMLLSFCPNNRQQGTL